MNIARRLVPGMVAGSLLLSGASGVFAAKATPKAHWAALAGQVTNLSGSTFTLTLNPKAVAKGKAANAVQVTLAATAKTQARKGTTGALATGDYAVVVGARLGTVFTANRVIFSATAFPEARTAALIRARHTLNVLSHHTVRGTVVSSTATSLVVTVRAGTTRTFQITPTTTFYVNGQVSQTAPALTTGEKVRVVFTVDKSTKQATATAVGVRA